METFILCPTAILEVLMKIKLKKYLIISEFKKKEFKKRILSLKIYLKNKN